MTRADRLVILQKTDHREEGGHHESPGTNREDNDEGLHTKNREIKRSYFRKFPIISLYREGSSEKKDRSHHLAGQRSVYRQHNRRSIYGITILSHQRENINAQRAERIKK